MNDEDMKMLFCTIVSNGMRVFICGMRLVVPDVKQVKSVQDKRCLTGFISRKSTKYHNNSQLQSHQK
jgi:hypothetical protein